VVNDPGDLGIARRLEHLEEIYTAGRDVNRRMVDTFRVGQGCVLASPAFERVARPTLEHGRRAPALRFGDPRVMAVTGALCASVHAVDGFTNRSLRTRVATLLGTDYSQAQMSYDLRRLRLKGVIRRLEHANTYVLTEDGIRVAVFYVKVHDRPEAPARPDTTGTSTGQVGLPDPGTPRRRLRRPGPHGGMRTRLKRQPLSDQGR
jgi:hypothetical protein